MSRLVTLTIVLVVAVVGGWLLLAPPTDDARDMAVNDTSPDISPAQRPGRAIMAPGQAGSGSGKARIKGSGTLSYSAQGPSPIALADVPRTLTAGGDAVRGGARIESRFTDAQVRAAQKAAAKQKKSAAVQNLDGSSKPVGQKPKLQTEFNAIDAADCCDDVPFTAAVPPDPDLAVGPNHVIAVVNVAFEIYDKNGNSLSGGPVGFSEFFDPTIGGTQPGDPTPGCPAFVGFGLFDPDVVYDAENDRFILGIDGDGTDFCIAASQTGDPTGGWNRYSFTANINGAFFDFPHMGVGQSEIFVGSNQFGGALPFGFEGRVFAVDKAKLYDGAAVLPVVTREVKPAVLGLNVKLDGTPQPAQSPTGSANYIMTEFFDGVVHSVYSWEEPFGADVFDIVGDVDLATASGVPCPVFSCFPVPWPQKGSREILAGNDFRGQETKVHDGYLWTTQTISCNPGKGTRNCVRWAQIDPTQVMPAPDQTAFPLDASTDGVVQAGVFGSDWGYRSFPSLAVNTCGDMAVGYSFSAAPGRSGGTWYPSIYVAGRKAGDPPGTIGGERLLKKALIDYTSFQNSGGAAASRWGDYTGMQTYGDEFWYIGEYAGGEPAISVISGNNLANWGTYIGMFKMPGCD